MQRIVALALLLCLAACSNGGGDGARAEPSPSPSFPIATVLLDNGDRSTLVIVEVAETAEQRERGLSERESLPEDEGMVFVFFEERDTGLSFGSDIPLSVAFFDATGEIVGIVDAEECSDETCSTAPYMGALAVNQGAFDEWEISEGDHLQLTR
ncbi:MAG TPA: DUF192 domain-containing protein [Actinomycetota bacterium]|nr:DUF192 domain-containing protein [Actinomycetota bacterium]